MKRIYETLARFLDALASATEPLDVGSFGPPGKYSKFERARIGPQFGVLAMTGLICHAGAANSGRRTRNGALVRKWRPVRCDACRERAAELRRQASRLPDDPTASEPGATQRTLF